MARIDRSKIRDSQVQQILDVLTEYEQIHPNALIEARRTGYDFIHIRIIDPDFHTLERIGREEHVWPILDRLPDEILVDIMGLTLVTPEEAPYSGSSLEFDDPLPTFPIPHLSEVNQTGAKKHTNGLQYSNIVSHRSTLGVPLLPNEVSALQQVGQSQGLSGGELVREWVLEKLATQN